MKRLVEQLDRAGDLLTLSPQLVGRFYVDGNRLGQRPSRAPKPPYYAPERWIGSSTMANNPPQIPAAGCSVCSRIRVGGAPAVLKDLLAHPEFGPRLLGERRYIRHRGTFRVLIKLLDAYHPIFFHVHADDAFVRRHPKVYPNEQFGKDEAYHFLDLPAGRCPYTHIGLYPGITMKDVLAAMKKGTDHTLALSPVGHQTIGEGYIVRAGLLHRPGTAVTLEIQQPSDVYTLLQDELGGEPVDPKVMHVGFRSLEEAIRNVVRWKDNQTPGLLEKSRLVPQRAKGFAPRGGKVDWVFPPRASKKFSGVRAVVDTRMTLKMDQPAVLFIWRGNGTVNGAKVAGGGGPVGTNDEFFVGLNAAMRGLEIVNSGDEPLVVFALFAAEL